MYIKDLEYHLKLYGCTLLGSLYYIIHIYVQYLLIFLPFFYELLSPISHVFLENLNTYIAFLEPTHCWLTYHGILEKRKISFSYFDEYFGGMLNQECISKCLESIFNLVYS